MPNAIGRLTKITDTTGTTQFAYDTLGRVTKTTKTIEGIPFVVSRTYDLLDRLNALTYPVDNAGNIEQVGYYYNERGLLAQVLGGSDYVTDIKYNALGQVTHIAYGNGVSTNNTYDPSNFRIQAVQTITASGTIQSLSYSYDQVGNVSTITDGVTHSNPALSLTQSFQYDGLYRLTGATGAYGVSGAVETRSYQPDPIGNLLAKDGVTYSYPQPVGVNPPPQPHAVASGSNGFSASYDANGNMIARHDPTTGDDLAYTYDFENRLSAITDTTTKKTLANYYYDGDGGRVAKVTYDAKTGKAKRTLYIGKLYEVRPDYLAKHYFAGATRIATAMLAGGTDPRSFNPHPGGPLPPGTRVPNVPPSFSQGQPHQSPVAHGRGWACGLWRSSVQMQSGFWTYVTEGVNGLIPLLPLLTLGFILLRRKILHSWWIGSPALNVGHPFRGANGARLKPCPTWKERVGGKVFQVIFSPLLRGGEGRVRRVKRALAGLAAELSETFHSFTFHPSRSLASLLLIASFMNATMPPSVLAMGPAITTPPLDPVYWYHADHLGSSSVLTDANGQVVQEVAYLPYGEVRANRVTGGFDTPFKYTGQESDEESGLYFYNARYYDARIGRFVTPDPGVPGGVRSPQSFNRYSYVNNSPLNFLDPSGRDVVESFLIGLVAGGVGGVVGYYTQNPILAGMAAGMVAGAIAGGIHGGFKGAMEGAAPKGGP